jgi:hypothetical protein
MSDNLIIIRTSGGHERFAVDDVLRYFSLAFSSISPALTFWKVERLQAEMGQVLCDRRGGFTDQNELRYFFFDVLVQKVCSSLYAEKDYGKAGRCVRLLYGMAFFYYQRDGFDYFFGKAWKPLNSADVERLARCAFDYLGREADTLPAFQLVVGDLQKQYPGYEWQGYELR